MADGFGTLALAMVALQLHPELTDEQLARVLGLHCLKSVRFWRVRVGLLFERGQVMCEACGRLFPASAGYYEPGEYAYCAECCHW